MSKARWLFASATIAVAAFAAYTLHDIRAASVSPAAATTDHETRAAIDDEDRGDPATIESPAWRVDDGEEEDAFVAGTVSVAQIAPPAVTNPTSSAAPEAMIGWRNPATSRPDE